MPARYRVFLDTSALLAAVASEVGGAAQILRLAEAGQLEIVVTRQVITEAERNVRRKLPGGLSSFQQALVPLLRLLPDPPPEAVRACEKMIASADAPILAAAMVAQVDYLVTLDRKHFLDDPGVAEKSGLRIGTPGDFLAWLRNRMR